MKTARERASAVGGGGEPPLNPAHPVEVGHRAAARAGLLHDLYLYDPADRSAHPGNQCLDHPEFALRNASALCPDLTDKFDTYSPDVKLYNNIIAGIRPVVSTLFKLLKGNFGSIYRLDRSGIQCYDNCIKTDSTFSTI